jgi:hypothetical protein
LLIHSATLDETTFFAEVISTAIMHTLPQGTWSKMEEVFKRNMHVNIYWRAEADMYFGEYGEPDLFYTGRQTPIEYISTQKQHMMVKTQKLVGSPDVFFGSHLPEVYISGE